MIFLLPLEKYFVKTIYSGVSFDTVSVDFTKKIFLKKEKKIVKVPKYIHCLTSSPANFTTEKFL